MMELRRAARLVVIDADRRILLLRHRTEEGRVFWATPGGGVESGETVTQAAEREAAEELGATDTALRELWTGHVEFSIGSRRYSQDETFFLIEGGRMAHGPAVEAVHLREGITELRWWTREDIARTEELVFPADLATRLAALGE